MTKRADNLAALKKEFRDNGWTVRIRNSSTCCWLKHLDWMSSDFTQDDFFTMSTPRRTPYYVAAEAAIAYLKNLGVWTLEQREASGNLRPQFPERWYNVPETTDGNDQD